jgi:hypothetical protein
MNKNLNVYIATSDSNIFIIKYFQYFFNKYWSDKIVVNILGFKKPQFKLYKNFKFVSLAKEQKNGANGWSNYLVKYFSKIKDEFFIFGIDDFMIVRPVNKKLFRISKKLLTKNIGRIDLQPAQFARHNSCFKNFCLVDGYDFKEIIKNKFFYKTYPVAGAFSIWNRKWFLKTLDKNMSPWQWEIEGSKKIKNDNHKVICSWNNSVIKKIELISDRAWPGIINILGIRNIDIKKMKKIKDKNDRIVKFKKINGKISGYEEFAGRNWVKKILGN